MGDTFSLSETVLSVTDFHPLPFNHCDNLRQFHNCLRKPLEGITAASGNHWPKLIKIYFQRWGSGSASLQHLAADNLRIGSPMRKYMHVYMSEGSKQHIIQTLHMSLKQGCWIWQVAFQADGWSHNSIVGEKLGFGIRHAGVLFWLLHLLLM